MNTAAKLKKCFVGIRFIFTVGIIYPGSFGQEPFETESPPDNTKNTAQAVQSSDKQSAPSDSIFLKKGEQTGAVVNLKMNNLTSTPAHHVLKLLQGRALNR